MTLTTLRSSAYIVFHTAGFLSSPPQLSLVPTWPYVGLNKIDFTWGPQGSNLADTIGTAFKLNMTVVLKPHLDPPAYNAGACCRRAFRLLTCDQNKTATIS